MMSAKPAASASWFFRFRISSLLALVLFMGVSFAALRSASRVWADALFAVTLLALTSAILLTAHRRGRTRAFWLGFTLFGSIYLAASLIPPLESRLLSHKLLAETAPHPRWDDVVLDWIPNTTVSQTVLGTVPSPSSRWADVALSEIVVTDGRSTSPPANYIKRIVGWSNSEATEAFNRIGHSLFTLILALIGGQLSRFLAGRRP
jgi:hypothetical protein